MTPPVATRKLSLVSFGAGALGASLLLSGCSMSYHPYRVVEKSMLPLFRPGDMIVVDQANQARSDVHDGDIIALRRNDAIVLKRILAMSGETISGDHRKIFRNGKQLDEPYLAPATSDDPPAPITFAPRTVAPGELFVMGDNRDHSFDSRVAEYAPVQLSDVVGKYCWTYWHAPTVTK